MEKEKEGTKRMEERESFPKVIYDKVAGRISAGGNTDSSQDTKSARNWSGIWKGLVVVIAVIALICFFAGAVSGRTYNSYEVVEETSVKNTAMVDYVPYQNSLLKYSKDD